MLCIGGNRPSDMCLLTVVLNHRARFPPLDRMPMCILRKKIAARRRIASRKTIPLPPRTRTVTRIGYLGEGPHTLRGPCRPRSLVVVCKSLQSQAASSSNAVPVLRCAKQVAGFAVLDRWIVMLGYAELRPLIRRLSAGFAGVAPTQSFQLMMSLCTS